MADAVNDQLARIANVLESVPMKPGVEPSAIFLNIYKLSFNDIKSLNLTEARWDQLHPVSVSKLLKLGISFGNLVKSFLIEQAAYETKQNNEKNMRRTGMDPFSELRPQKTPLPAHYRSFTRNFYVILKNFDIGTERAPEPRNRRNSRGLGSVEPDTPVSHVSGGSGAFNSSPIRLNSRQLLIEKLEINIRLDALFTMKIVLKLLVTMFTIVRTLIDSCTDDLSELSAIRAYSEALSIISSNSSTSNLDSVSSMDNYVRSIKDISARVNLGLLEPLCLILLSEVVEPRVITSFQNLANSI